MGVADDGGGEYDLACGDLLRAYLPPYKRGAVLKDEIRL